ncbi:Magnetosome protein MamT [Candidatus Magnetaquicoccaceae bacterium FCR-1]|uniref:Magnetosome protein MamT n=1 Tax=Candidatus Magnetaquiglobus chichijimensis TaxID=3141448 RepID=A0ABQ0CAI9_9PROT
MSGLSIDSAMSKTLAAVIVLIIVAGLSVWAFWGKDKQAPAAMFAEEATGQVQGEVFGSIPKPTQPSLKEPVLQLVNPPSNSLKRMLVKRIPTINPGASMPHPTWGPCTNCHLIRGGAPAGSQPATPVAKVWEQVSAYYKVGPPIMPNSTRPHPPSGRCIKCHDILVYVQTK